MAKQMPVPRTFDDQLAVLVQHLKASGETVTGVSTDDLEKDLIAQREGKQKDAELANAAKAFHVEFSEAQAARYGRYMKAVQVLRAVYRDQPEKLTQMAVLKRKMAPRTPKAPA
jgi:hypothetical protein